MSISISDVVDLLSQYVPAGFGALIGLRYAKDSSPIQKTSSFFLGAGLSVFFTPGIVDYFHLTPHEGAAISVVIAVIGMDILSGLMAAVSQFRENPIQVGRKWINAWLGRPDV